MITERSDGVIELSFEDGVDPIKPDTWRVEKGCIPGVSGSPAGNGGGWYCNPPSNDQWQPGR